ncbi:glycosyltransferase [Flammeovirga pectinis]|nr:glycosyltransferase [Flammeovirga pectinis]
MNIKEYFKDEIQNKRIILLGRKSQIEISHFLNISDLLIMESLTEGFPTSMVEAIGCGKNVVTTNVSGAKYMVVNGKNGYIVKARDPQVFAKKSSMD